MWKFVASGAAVAALVLSFGVGYELTGPGPDRPGEASATVYGVVVDRVPLPADPDGRAEWPQARIRRGLAAALVGAIAAGAAAGSVVGWCAWAGWSKRRRVGA